tara:strand:+ start:45 stop:554 length:510 start_codon:yes stop_codon:yes gene_type:complete
MALKKTSSTIVISGAVTESAPNAYTQNAIDLQLNPLDNEVFVVEAVDINSDAPEALAGLNTAVRASLSNTSRTTIGRLNDSNVFSTMTTQIMAAGFVDGGVGFASLSPDSPTAGSLEYIGILATNDFFIGVDGTGNTIPKTARFKVYGYRAKADSATYAALVQSELLSQ